MSVAQMSVSQGVRMESIIEWTLSCHWEGPESPSSYTVSSVPTSTPRLLSFGSLKAVNLSYDFSVHFLTSDFHGGEGPITDWYGRRWGGSGVGRAL